jgi:hypothetical protein
MQVKKELKINFKMFFVKAFLIFISLNSAVLMNTMECSSKSDFALRHSRKFLFNNYFEIYGK